MDHQILGAVASIDLLPIDQSCEGERVHASRPFKTPYLNFNLYAKSGKCHLKFAQINISTNMWELN